MRVSNAACVLYLCCTCARGLGLEYCVVSPTIYTIDVLCSAKSGLDSEKMNLYREVVAASRRDSVSEPGVGAGGGGGASDLSASQGQQQSSQASHVRRCLLEDLTLCARRDPRLFVYLVPVVFLCVRHATATQHNTTQHTLTLHYTTLQYTSLHDVEFVDVDNVHYITSLRAINVLCSPLLYNNVQ